MNVEMEGVADASLARVGGRGVRGFAQLARMAAVTGCLLSVGNHVLSGDGGVDGAAFDGMDDGCVSDVVESFVEGLGCCESCGFGC